MPVPSDSELSLFLDLAPDTRSMATEVHNSLRDKPRWLPSKFFYDAEGSRLFDAICDLEEYYPTRTELAILRDMLPGLRKRLGQNLVLLEYGSGSSIKTRLLLEGLPAISTYVPIDISGQHLALAGEALKQQFPDLDILPVCADYGQDIPFPWQADRLSHLQGADRIVFFPGSTIGNFSHPAATAFLRRMASLVGSGGRILLGADLVKEVPVLEAAYDDASGVTAAFNRNILRHINERLGSDFDAEAFGHRAFFDREERRIEMHLVATRPMRIRVPGDGDAISDLDIQLEAGESIRTEYSHKYRLEDVAAMADAAGLDVEHVWTDERDWFSVQLLRTR